MNDRQYDTCKLKECELYTMYGTNCPNYIINSFISSNGQTYQVKDCAPIRSNLLFIQINNDVFELKKMFVEMRNSFSKAEKVAQHIVNDIAGKNIEAIAITKQPDQHTITATIVPQIN